MENENEVIKNVGTTRPKGNVLTVVSMERTSPIPRFTILLTSFSNQCAKIAQFRTFDSQDCYCGPHFSTVGRIGYCGPLRPHL